MISLMLVGCLMIDRLLICTDLDRTLIPNGPQTESAHARACFSRLVARPEVTLAYVSGRHRALVEQAITEYGLPIPDFVIGDVGTTIYHVGEQHDWQLQAHWEQQIAQDWNAQTWQDLSQFLDDLAALRLQEDSRQNTHKLSYYVPLKIDSALLTTQIDQRLQAHAINARLVWSVDEPAGVGLLDILPRRASKFHAIESLMTDENFTLQNSIFCGDSGNDMQVLVSPLPAVLVANCQPEVRQQALKLAHEQQTENQLYIARGGFMQMNGNYSAGMLEGIAHYYPDCVAWMVDESEVESA